MRGRGRTVLVAILVAVAGCASDEDPATTVDSTATTTAPSIDDATVLAQASMPVDLIDEIVADMIDELCQAAGTGETTALALELAALPRADDGVLREAVDALRDGAALYCPGALEAAPSIGDAVFAAATAAVAAERPDTSPPSTVGPPMTVDDGRT